MRELAERSLIGTYHYSLCGKPDISTIRARIVELASGEKQLSVFGSGRDQISPLMHLFEHMCSII